MLKKKRKIFLFILVLFLSISSCVVNDNSFKSVKDNEIEKYLHRPSPEWRDQIIYFIMIDRFNDGDKSNNDQGVGEYDPTQNAKYSGGDLKGIIEKLYYIKELGATALWITPPVANQWWDPWVNYSGYHGYWAENFKEVDKHYGTIEDYKRLSASLHKNNMYLIQDIVCNHVGNFFRYNGYDSNDITKNIEFNSNSKPVMKPSQKPFNMNNPKNKEEREAAIYNFTPDIENYQDYNQVLTYQMSGLDDLNTRNPMVINALKDSFRYWIKEVGVDGYRIDTVIYVDHEFWHNFINSTDPENPGIEKFAYSLGKKKFYTFGETWVNVNPYKPEGDILAASYQGSIEKPEMTSVLNFPMHIDILRVFAEGKPTSYLTYRLDNTKKYYRNPELLLNFVDNHDMNRFLTGASYQSLQLALMFIMTIPGVPVIYYGTEQNFTETRGSMFKEGYGSGGKDNFDTNSKPFQYLKSLINIRKNNKLFTRGELKVLRDSPYGAGIFAYRMDYNKESALIIINTSESPMILDNLETGLKEATYLKLLMSNLKTSKDAVVGKNGRLNMKIPGKTGLIYKVMNKKGKIVKETAKVSIDNLTNNQILKSNYELKGKIKGSSKVYLYVDGDMLKPIKINADKDGNWSTILPVEDLENGIHSVVAQAKTDNDNEFSLSESYNFETAIEYQLLAKYIDKIGDDKGPTGKYLYPTHESFKNQMDIESVEIYQGGKNLKISIKMAKDISTVWNPKFGFDHVSFSIFINIPENIPGKNPVSYLPFQNVVMKDGEKWNYMLLLGGWMSYIYESKGASSNSFGTPSSPSPKIIVDKDNRTIDVYLSGKSLNNPMTFKNSKFYITTWDYDGLENSFRKIDIKPQAYTFGGASPDSPYIMDDTEIIKIK